jgi:diguanylate cyclase (GGDEF)-like protein
MEPAPVETLDIRKLRKAIGDTAVVQRVEVARSLTPTACLVCIHSTDPIRGTRYLIGDRGLVIGRDNGCEIQVNDKSISRRHVSIEPRLPGEYQITDLNSSNGTFVNDLRVRSQLLQDGCYVRVGDSMFRFLAGGNVEASYHEEVQRLSTLDPLTDLYNRRHFDDILEREVEQAVRLNRPLAVVLFDIDHFKGINDRYGHLAGDYVLRSLANRFKSLTRPDECLARYGGEEFVLLLPETTLERATVCAEQFRRTVVDKFFDFEGERFFVTISAGIGFTKDGVIRSAEELLKQAEERLYQAKRTGRNRVIPPVQIARGGSPDPGTGRGKPD